MKRLAVLICTIVVAVIVVIGPSDSSRAGYNTITKQINCAKLSDCLHETGHFADGASDWPSYSADWKQAVNIYCEVAWQEPRARTSMTEVICKFPGIGSPRQPEHDVFTTDFWEGGWGGYTELYADMLRLSGGHWEVIPPTLGAFYNFNTISGKLKELGYAE